MNISQYEKQGFEGVDVDLTTSLLDYGLIWKEYKYNLKKRGVKKGEILALTCDHNQNTDYGYFTKADLVNEDWINYKSVADYTGQTVAQLLSQSTGLLLSDLISYYGKENFGF